MLRKSQNEYVVFYRPLESKVQTKRLFSNYKYNLKNQGYQFIFYCIKNNKRTIFASASLNLTIINNDLNDDSKI